MKKVLANKKKQRNFVDENPIEAKRDIPSRVAGSFTNDLFKPAVTKDLWEQLLGVEQKDDLEFLQASGDIAENEAIDIRALERRAGKIEQKVQNIDPGLDYHREIRFSQEKISQENESALAQQIQRIQFELKQLASSSKELETSFAQVTVASAPVNPGKYHLNFFEWVLSVIQSARLRVEESQTWLSLFASKRAKKQYWSMFKKHGTSFGLSNERVVATQTG